MIFYNYGDVFIKNTYQLIILGPGGSGKTKSSVSFVKIMNEVFGLKTSIVMPWSESMVTTSNFVLHNVTIPRGFFEDIHDPIQVAIYDMGGQFRYMEMWRELAEDADAIIGVVDISRRNTLKQIPLMLPKGMMEGIPIRLVVNKADLFLEFSRNATKIGEAIYKILQNTALFGIVNYQVIYRGSQQFILENKIYKYGDNIPIFRKLTKNKKGFYDIKISDFEILIAPAFKEVLPNLTDHNANLFGREYMLQIFELLYNTAHEEDINSLPDSLLIASHFEAPPFISWGEDPQGFIPSFDNISEEKCIEAVKKMLVDDSDIINMIIELAEQGYSFDDDPMKSFAFASAELEREDPKLTYYPVNKAFLPPEFIHKMITYASQKQQIEDEEFFA